MKPLCASPADTQAVEKQSRLSLGAVSELNLWHYSSRPSQPLEFIRIYEVMNI